MRYPIKTRCAKKNVRESEKGDFRVKKDGKNDARVTTMAVRMLENKEYKPED